jgi:hypothetical protein
MFIGEPSLEWIIQPQMMFPIASSASCAPLRMPITPGIFSAAEVSMLLILACACGERMKWACFMPGTTMSSVYRPLPVMNRLSSLRATRAPMPSIPMSKTPPVG